MKLSREDIILGLPKLPAFPRVVSDILQTLSDAHAGMTVLVSHLQHDPIISARILSAANRQIRHSGREPVGDVYTAASYIGLNQIHRIVVGTSLLDFAKNARCSRHFWEHSLAVGICAQELAREFGVNHEHALVAGLLHDVGDLWMRSCHPTEYERLLDEHEPHAFSRMNAEQTMFGMDHCEIGGLLAAHWDLPQDIGQAIAQHHRPSGPNLSGLVAITHLAQQICHGLDLPYHLSNQVDGLSEEAVRVLGEDWADNLADVFGRVEARFRFDRTVLQ